MSSYPRYLTPLFVALVCGGVYAQPSSDGFVWPGGKRAALSLSFDDARASQVDVGLGLFGRYEARVTFYVVPSNVEPRLEGWKRLAAQGHEIANHSVDHPCTGNFGWSRSSALEAYTLAQMRDELTEANRRIEALLGVRPETFAYPCGQSFVGRGQGVQSYVPLVAELFLAGRGWKDETPNDPGFVDLAQVTALEMDGLDFDALEPLLEEAVAQGQWVVLAGHEIGPPGAQTTRVAMLERLLAYAEDPAHGIWIAPVGTVARYIRRQRER